jgi:hypothetical protein
VLCPWLASKTVPQFQLVLLIGFSPSGACSGSGQRVFGLVQSKDTKTFRAGYIERRLGMALWKEQGPSALISFVAYCCVLARVRLPQILHKFMII